ncbi:MAG: hypothetical protein IJA55_00325 [Clostridia bacterium]|nr:hypothetical protein [Clostridia bacterium]
MSVTQEYKCPCCGGAIGFDSSIQKMKCPYCDCEFEMEALAAYDNDLNSQQADNMNWNTNVGESWQPGEEEGLRVYVCNSCGGEIVCDENSAATSCPYCDNPVVFKGQFAGDLKPDLVIPFKFDKAAAKAALKKHYEGKRLLPKVFKDQNHIDEIKGVYVPFWLFDATADAHVRFKATKTRTWSDSRYNYTETSYFAVNRSGNVAFANVPVDGSTKMADDMMESIEPFNMNEAVDFQTAYLAGYLADKYDVSAEESINRANQRIKNSAELALEATVHGYTSVQPEYSSVSFYDGYAKYALLPVWILNTNWKGKKYTFAMNGQTGKFVGDLPMDKGIYKKWLWSIAAIASAACFALSWLMWWA